MKKIRPIVWKKSEIVVNLKDQSERAGAGQRQRGAYLAHPDLGTGHAGIVTNIHFVEMPPNSKTKSHWHHEAFVIIDEGKGYTLFNGVKYDWEKGDVVYIPPRTWHQHFNPDPDNIARYIAITAEAMHTRLEARFGSWTFDIMNEQVPYRPPPEDAEGPEV